MVEDKSPLIEILDDIFPLALYLVKELVTTISGLIPWGGAGDKHFWH